MIRAVDQRGSVVAPYTGAWIETLLAGLISTIGAVAPYTGAWIETMTVNEQLMKKESRSLHGSVD